MIEQRLTNGTITILKFNRDHLSVLRRVAMIKKSNSNMNFFLETSSNPFVANEKTYRIYNYQPIYSNSQK